MKRMALITVLLLVGCAKKDKFDGNKVDIAKITVQKFAMEAYPQWAASHPDKACPDSLDQLTEYMDKKSMKDPWGHDYKLMCGPSIPAGAKGVAIISFGEDGKEGTADDIKSWE